MTYGKTVQKLRAEYAPYDKMPAFEDGMRDYTHRGFNPLVYYTGVDGQAYDRGQECAMRMARLATWNDENVGAD